MGGVRRRHGDDDDFQAKRRRGVPLINEAEKQLQDIIGRMGDETSSSSIESNLESMCNLLKTEIDSYRDIVIDIIAGCAIYLPNRLTVYSSLVGLLNAQNFNFGGDVVEKLISEQQSLLEQEKYDEALSLSVFLCDLGNCKVLTLQSVGEYLESFVAATFEDNVPQVRTDWFAYAVLHCIPWIGAELADKAPEQLDNILEGISKYLEARKKDHVTLLQVWRPGGSPHEQEDYLDCIWEQIQVLKKAEWKEKHIPRYYKAFEATLQDALQHNLPSFSPPEHKDESHYPFPTVVFRLFDYADCPEDGTILPGAHSIERFLIEEELAWIINNNCLDRKKCARELMKFANENPTVAMGYVIFEVIFSSMFRLPTPKHPQLFYGALLLELCRVQATSYPQILVQSVELLYARADAMQPACIDRFVDWFSFHLSNFQYRYSWSDWSNCLEKESWSGSQVFAREVFEKCRRLGSYEKITQAVPPAFLTIMPVRPEVRFILDDETEPGYDRAQYFEQMFQERQSADAFLEQLKTDDDLGYSPVDFSIFVAVMLKMASKTYSHNFAALTKYSLTLKTVCDHNELFQEKLLEALYFSWKANQQMMMILIDKLLKMQVLDCSMVIHWLFDDKMKQEQDRQWVFEVLNTALEKLSRHVRTIEKDVKALKEQLEAARDSEDEEKAEEILNEYENAKEKLEQSTDFEKQLFHEILGKFTRQLSDIITDNEAEGLEVSTPYYHWIQGRFQQIFLWHVEVLWKFVESLNEEVFAEGVHPSVVDSFKQFISLKQ